MDRTLLETVTAARAGDGAAFDSLFARNMPQLLAFIRMKAGGAVLERESVADIAQSVCREILEDMGEFEYRGEREFRNFMLLQASRKIASRYRFHRAARRDIARERKARRASDEEADTLVECYATLCSPSVELNAREQVSRIEAAIAELPENQRDAVVLSKVMQLPYSELADAMEISESAARGLVARGLARLTILLDGE